MKNPVSDKFNLKKVMTTLLLEWRINDYAFFDKREEESL